MELTFKISTDESMSLNEAKELMAASDEDKVTPSELAVDLIRDGLRRRRERRAAEALQAAAAR